MLSTENNVKLPQQVKSGFKRTINWGKYQSDPKTYPQNIYLNDLIDPSFQEVNRLFVLYFENEGGRTSHSHYYLPKVTIKDYNVMIDGKNFFDQPINNKFKTYENIRKITASKGNDYKNGSLLDYLYLKKNYKVTAIDLSKQQALDFEVRAIRKIDFTANLDRAGNTKMFSLLKKQEKLFQTFHKEL